MSASRVLSHKIHFNFICKIDVLLSFSTIRKIFISTIMLRKVVNSIHEKKMWERQSNVKITDAHKR